MGIDDLKSLWVGDRVQIISRKIHARFEGIHADGSAILRYHDEILIVDPVDLKLEDEVPEIPEIHFDESIMENNVKAPFQVLKSQSIFEHVIDLHYEKLAPERIQNPHEHIIAFQIEKCQEFINKAIQRRFPFIRIIHGKGQGKLKTAVEQLLAQYKEVYMYSTTPDLGAVEVRLDYL